MAPNAWRYGSPSTGFCHRYGKFGASLPWQRAVILHRTVQNHRL